MKRHLYIYHEIADKFNGNIVPLISVSELLDTLGKSGSHLVSIESDLPKPVVAPQQSLAVPSTLQGVHSLQFCPGISRLGRAVSQLPGAEYVTSSQYQSLLQSLAGLVEAYDRFRRVLHQIPVAELRQADEASNGQT